MLAATSPSFSNKSNPLLPFPKDIHPIFTEMEPFQSQTHKHKTKRHKKSLTQDQLRLLETSFNHDHKLEPARKAQLAHDLGLPPRQIAIWYQNKRARWKTQSLELDYRTLQLRLDSVFDEKRRLEGEVRILRTELQRAREMLLVMNLAAPPVSSLSASYNENASPSFPEVQWEKPLQVDELYSCLMSPDEQTVGLQINHQ